MKFSEKIIKNSVVSERSYHLAESGLYVLKVDCKASKTDIRRALKEFFNVDVVSINTSIIRGKVVKKGLGAKKAPIMVKLPNYKKAFISLKDGQELPKFHDTTANDTSSNDKTIQ